MKRLEVAEGMTNQNLTSNQQVARNHKFAQSGFGLNPTSRQSHIPPPTQLVTPNNEARIMAQVRRLEDKLRVLQDDLAKFKQDSESTQVKILFQVWDSVDGFNFVPSIER